MPTYNLEDLMGSFRFGDSYSYVTVDEMYEEFKGRHPKASLEEPTYRDLVITMSKGRAKLSTQPRGWKGKAIIGVARASAIT